MRIVFEGDEKGLKTIKEYLERGFEEVRKEINFIDLEKLGVYTKIDVNGNVMVFETNYFDIFKGVASSNKIVGFLLGRFYDDAKKTFVNKLKSKIAEMKLNVNIVRVEL